MEEAVDVRLLYAPSTVTRKIQAEARPGVEGL